MCASLAKDYNRTVMSESKLDPSNFAATMISFLEWYFRTLDPQFASKLLGQRSIEQGARELFASVIEPIQGNRAANAPLTAADFGAIMDAIAALHLRTRHGDQAVSGS